MLIDGEIDLMSDVSYTEERAEMMLFSELPMGSEEYYLFIDRDNTEITPEDYSTLNGKKVGVYKGSYQLGLFIEWAAAHGIEADIVELTCSVEEALDMLHSGEMDVYLALDSYGNPETTTPIYWIGSSDFFFAVNNNRPDLLGELNVAMSRIRDEDKYYNEQLNERYTRTTSANLSLTVKERNWLSDHGPIRVGYQDDYMAFCAADRTGELTGALKEYLALAEKSFGNAPITFETIAYPTKAAVMEALANGEIDCMFPANLTDSDAENMNAVITPAVMTTEVYAVVRQAEQQSFVIKRDLHAAVDQNNTIFDMFLSDHFPGVTSSYYSDTPTCLKAVADGDVDCLMISNYRYSSIRALCDSLKLTTVPTGVDLSYGFAINDGQPELYSILTRATRLVPASNISAALNYYSTEDAKVSVSDFIRDHLATVIAVIAAVVIFFLLLILRNMRSQQRAEAGEKLIAATEHDELTGLYNRSFFYEFANRIHRENPNKPMDSIVVNIDQFHSLNELNGREFGDRVLMSLGAEILGFLAESEGVGSRVNADDFYIFCTPQKDYHALLDRFQSKVNRLSENASIRLRMGVMPWKEGLEPVQLLDRAHTVCNRVRGSDKRFVVYDEEMLEREHLNERLLNDLDRALRDHEFQVYYQPKFNVTVEPPVLSSAEALVRWQHPELGLVSPAMFIPLFEENGLIQQLDRYVWREVASKMATWREKYGRVFPVSVNVSRIDLYDPDFITHISALVKEFNIRREDFLLEITESAYTEDSEVIVENVKKLRDAGFLIEMDDFGSGYSSLNMISTLPIDVIKLDMQFIRNAFRGHSDTRMLEAVLGIAEMLYLPTVAEGVETAEQMQALKSMGCDVIQGYYFSKPIPAEDYERFIEERMSVAEDIASAEHSHHRPRLSYEEYSYDELHDHLTGLYNITAFNMLVKDADQYHTALLIAEIVNEEGQTATEQVIRHVADVMKRSFRPVDHVCRISNSGFGIIMSRVDSGIREQVEQKIDHVNDLLKTPYNDLPAVSVAVGVAFADRANPGNGILEDAESALRGLLDQGESGCAFH